jgi:H+/Cl- antiporter ClcA
MLVGLAVGVLGHLFRSRLMVIIGVGAVFLGTFLLPLTVYLSKS